jgi:hypothetical protein
VTLQNLFLGEPDRARREPDSAVASISARGLRRLREREREPERERETEREREREGEREGGREGGSESE